MPRNYEPGEWRKAVLTSGLRIYISQELVNNASDKVAGDYGDMEYQVTNMGSTKNRMDFRVRVRPRKDNGGK